MVWGCVKAEDRHCPCTNTIVRLVRHLEALLVLFIFISFSSEVGVEFPADAVLGIWSSNSIVFVCYCVRVLCWHFFAMDSKALVAETTHCNSQG